MKPETEYVVWIAGFTGKGAGPYSEREFVSTPVAGMLQLGLANIYLCPELPVIRCTKCPVESKPKYMFVMLGIAFVPGSFS